MIRASVRGDHGLVWTAGPPLGQGRGITGKDDAA